jgi:hypothetical protein
MLQMQQPTNQMNKESDLLAQAILKYLAWRDYKIELKKQKRIDAMIKAQLRRQLNKKKLDQ